MNDYPALAVALDVPTLEEADALATRLEGHADIFKVGLELLSTDARAVLGKIALRGSVFADVKLHDIPRTVHAACRNLAGFPVDYITIHLGGGRAMAEAAIEGACEGATRRGRGTPKILGVTVLTSLGEDGLAETGHTATSAELVQTRTDLAIRAGLDGIVCSPRDLRIVATSASARLLRVTPGIRPAGGETRTDDDQVRHGTPEAALEGGADILVVGRPIVGAQDPVGAAALFQQVIVARTRTRG